MKIINKINGRWFIKKPANGEIIGKKEGYDHYKDAVNYFNIYCRYIAAAVEEKENESFGY